MPKLDLRRQSVISSLVVVTLLLIGTAFGLLKTAELRAVGFAFRLRGREVPTTPVVIVAIDDNTFANTNMQWPWPRTYFAQMVDRLVEGGARVIAFDVFFSEPEGLGKPATYTVQGESLKDIADHYNVPLIELGKATDGGHLCPGQEITIPTTPPTQHRVVLDSIEDIARRYGVEVSTLLAVNNLTDPCARPASLLLIPVNGSVKHTVKDGETVAGIAAQFQVNPLAVLGEDNQPATDPLKAGQTLSIQFGDAAFAASIKAAGNVVLNGEKVQVEQVGGLSESVRQPIALLRGAMAGFGLSNVAPDVDGAVHSVQAWNASDQFYYSWPIVAASLYTGQMLGDQPTPTGFAFGNKIVPLENSFIHVNYRGPEGTIPTYSALKVVNGDSFRENPDTFKGKIVFVGATSESLHDTYATPFDFTNPTPGVEIMANTFDTLLSDRSLHRVPLAGGLLSILIAGIVALALTTIRRTGLAIGALLGVMVVYAVIWLGAFLFLRTEMPLIVPEITLFIGFVTPALERAVSEELEKRRVRGIFELFISPEMVGNLIEQGIDAMRGQRTELTILFSDIRGFTTMSEHMTPEELVHLLNEYLGAMTDIIHKNGGTVDKYEGDLVMAFFGAPIHYPDHAQRAARTAIEMRQELDRLRAKWAAEGGPTRLEMGIGLNTGEAFVGLIGSGRRVNYTVIGDSVNLASRLQDLTKDVHWPLLVSEFTHAKIKDEFDTEFAEARLVKGKTIPIGIYKVLGRKGAPESEKIRPLYT
jgi:adenylate cyclase